MIAFKGEAKHSFIQSGGTQRLTKASFIFAATKYM
jgi:hypothetical protein